MRFRDVLLTISLIIIHSQIKYQLYETVHFLKVKSYKKKKKVCLMNHVRTQQGRKKIFKVTIQHIIMSGNIETNKKKHSREFDVIITLLAFLQGHTIFCQLNLFYHDLQHFALS